MASRTPHTQHLRRVMVACALAILVAAAISLVGCGKVSSEDMVWPASDSGLPTFYYFGTPG